MSEYHGIVINISQKDPSIMEDFDIIGQKKVFFKFLILYKLSVTAEDLEAAIQRLQANLRDRYWFIRSFYFHFYNDDELIVVFRNKIFRVTPEPSTWGEVRAFGRSLGIPEKQLDFFPCRFSDEAY